MPMQSVPLCFLAAVARRRGRHDDEPSAMATTTTTAGSTQLQVPQRQKLRHHSATSTAIESAVADVAVTAADVHNDEMVEQATRIPMSKYKTVCFYR